MPVSRATTVAEYLKELPESRRSVVSAVRDVVRKNLPKGYEETMQYGMISYGIPLARFPNTYNGQPLGYAAIAAQKNHYALYLMGAYSDPNIDAKLREGFAKAGKKLDMGKSCLRFKSLDDLPLDVIGRVVSSVPPERLIELHDQTHAKPASKRTAATKS
jgi:Domain of unknown function (DU1801)